MIVVRVAGWTWVDQLPVLVVVCLWWDWTSDWSSSSSHTRNVVGRLMETLAQAEM